MAKPKPKQPRSGPDGTTEMTVGVRPSVVRALDAEVRRLRKEGGKWSRDDLVRIALDRSFNKRMSKRDRAELYGELRRRAGVQKLKGKGHLALNRIQSAREAYLQAASLELEALALLDEPDESTMLNALIEILALLKEGTGYMHLPEVPGGRRTVRSLQ